MAKYLKLFNNHSGYTAFTQTEEFVKPNVSHCIQENEVHYNPIPHDYSKDYLTFTALGNGEFSVNIGINVPTSKMQSISFKINDGEWATYQNVDNSAVTETVSSNIKRGDKIYVKGSASALANGAGGSNYTTFESTFDITVEGNIMSLLYGDNFDDETELTETYTFLELFHGMVDTLISAENLVLPALNATDSCYNSMFWNCNRLVHAPKELPAMTIGEWSYQEMFSGCWALVDYPEMYPIMTLSEGCYAYMFEYCRSLTSMPNLPATTLAYDCYYCMFQGCSGLTETTVLPATTLAEECYYHMFQNCSNLNSVTCLATDISANKSTTSWLSGVAVNGTFTKAANMTSWTEGASGIPSGWSVVDAN